MMTQGSADQPSLATSQRPHESHGRRRRKGGRVLATPVARASIGATFSTQFGAATLTSGGIRRNNPDQPGSEPDFSATQAELPPWLRRATSSTRGGVGGVGDTVFDAPSFAAGGTQSISRRVLRGSSQSFSPAAGTDGGSRTVTLADGGRSAVIAAAERRRRHERERAKERRHAVRLTRAYRAGELPDVRAVTPGSSSPTPSPRSRFETRLRRLRCCARSPRPPSPRTTAPPPLPPPPPIPPPPSRPRPVRPTNASPPTGPTRSTAGSFEGT